MAYGSVPSPTQEDVERYLTHILQYYRSASPKEEDVRHLQARYKAVGGSPLYDITARMVTATQRALDLAFPRQFRVTMAMKHSPPYIEDKVQHLAEDGFTHGVGVPLAPFRSRMSSGGYVRLVEEVNQTLSRPLTWRFATDWHLHPLFLDMWQRRILDAHRRLPEHTPVIFTNHSLPASILDGSDPYHAQFEATAKALAKRCGLKVWRATYQSAGGGKMPWLGPALGHVLAQLIGTGHRSVLLAPIGFVMDHLEVLYDLDVEARRMGKELGAEVVRTRMPNDDPLMVAVLTDVIRRAWVGAD